MGPITIVSFKRVRALSLSIHVLTAALLQCHAQDVPDLSTARQRLIQYSARAGDSYLLLVTAESVHRAHGIAITHDAIHEIDIFGDRTVSSQMKLPEGVKEASTNVRRKLPGIVEYNGRLNQTVAVFDVDSGVTRKYVFLRRELPKSVASLLHAVPNGHRFGAPVNRFKSDLLNLSFDRRKASCIALSRDTNIGIIAGSNGEIHCMTCDENGRAQQLFTFTLPQRETPFRVELSSDGRRAVFSTTRNGKTCDHVYVVSAQGATLSATLADTKWREFSTDGHLLFVRHKGTERRVVAYQTDGGTARVFEGCERVWGDVNAVLLRLCEHELFVSKNGLTRKVMSGCHSAVCSISPDSQLVAVLTSGLNGRDKRLFVWDIDKELTVAELSPYDCAPLNLAGHIEWVNKECLAAARKSKTIASGSVIHIWNTRMGRHVADLVGPSVPFPLSGSFGLPCSGGREKVVGALSYDGKMHMWQLPKVLAGE